MGCGVEVAAPGAFAASFWIAIARIASAGGAFALEDEVDAAKVGRWVAVGAMGAVVSPGHAAPPVLVPTGGAAATRRAVGPIGQAHTRAERLPR